VVPLVGLSSFSHASRTERQSSQARFGCSTTWVTGRLNTQEFNPPFLFEKLRCCVSSHCGFPGKRLLYV
jgi:hypothetical protein